ncbi:unnamed protein product [Prorocentrum cordatum]|uniref:Pre-mRNA-splicing factor Syf1/CRNKL1-like C-terminal HAT-repeats domain-containing protein n=1 Tax=Prorocentrum cordatum TaxID=2364126 RepID=A0ABN9QCJ8_9DINO|nr:unnamed protein product [Polarella glacialis]
MCGWGKRPRASCAAANAASSCAGEDVGAAMLPCAAAREDPGRARRRATARRSAGTVLLLPQSQGSFGVEVDAWPSWAIIALLSGWCWRVVVSALVDVGGITSKMERRRYIAIERMATADATCATNPCLVIAHLNQMAVLRWRAPEQQRFGKNVAEQDIKAWDVMFGCVGEDLVLACLALLMDVSTSYVCASIAKLMVIAERFDHPVDVVGLEEQMLLTPRLLRGRFCGLPPLVEATRSAVVGAGHGDFGRRAVGWALGPAALAAAAAGRLNLAVAPGGQWQRERCLRAGYFRSNGTSRRCARAGPSSRPQSEALAHLATPTFEDGKLARAAVAIGGPLDFCRASTGAVAAFGDGSGQRASAVGPEPRADELDSIAALVGRRARKALGRASEADAEVPKFRAESLMFLFFQQFCGRRCAGPAVTEASLAAAASGGRDRAPTQSMGSAARRLPGGAGRGQCSVKDAQVVQNRLYRSTKLWALAIDLEESLGTTATVRAAYDAAIELKVATPSLILSYATFLEERKYFEDAFKVYERGIKVEPLCRADGCMWLYRARSPGALLRGSCSAFPGHLVDPVAALAGSFHLYGLLSGYANICGDGWQAAPSPRRPSCRSGPTWRAGASASCARRSRAWAPCCPPAPARACSWSRRRAPRGRGGPPRGDMRSCFASSIGGPLRRGLRLLRASRGARRWGRWRACCEAMLREVWAACRSRAASARARVRAPLRALLLQVRSPEGRVRGLRGAPRPSPSCGAASDRQDAHGTAAPVATSLCDAAGADGVADLGLLANGTVRVFVHGVSLHRHCSGGPSMRWTLEFLVYVAPGGPCVLWAHTLFEYPTLRSVPVVQLSAWRCIFLDVAGNELGESTGAAVNHFGEFNVLQCPVPEHVANSVVPPGHSSSTVRVRLDAGSWALPVLNICVETAVTRRKVVGCMAPVFRFHEVEHVVQQWLHYHVAIGVEMIMLYDIDDTAKGKLELLGIPAELLRRVPGSRLSPLVPELLEHGAGRLRVRELFNHLAQNHCLFQVKGRADWLLNDMALDQYLAVPSGGPFGVGRVLERLSRARGDAATLDIPWVHFSGRLGRRSPYLVEALQHRQPRQEAPRAGGAAPTYLDLQAGDPVVNPENVLAVASEMAIGRRGTVHAEGSAAGFLRWNHYVDLHGPRLDGLPADVVDNGSAWAARLLRALAPPPPDLADWAPGAWCFREAPRQVREELRGLCCPPSSGAASGPPPEACWPPWHARRPELCCWAGGGGAA